MSARPSQPLRLVPLISGGGTTVLNLHKKIQAGELAAEIPLVIAGRECAGVERCRAVGLRTETLPRKCFDSIEDYSRELFAGIRAVHGELVVLAGFLSRILIPDDFALRVVNIHPSLIPAFCGQGMFGDHVHTAVLARGCKISGCTVHFCDNEYDHGPIILQRSVPVHDDDTPQSLGARVFEAECEAFPTAISWLAASEVKVIDGRVVRMPPQ